MIGKQISRFVPHEHLLAYLESILRVYNRYGRRDNKYKARIKILVHETGIESRSARQVEEEFAQVKGGVLTLPQGELDRIAAYFARRTTSGSTRPRSTSRARRSSTRPTAAGSSATSTRTGSRAMSRSPSR
jgi:sulfite reductase beta subunit-like hemoprotein